MESDDDGPVESAAERRRREEIEERSRSEDDLDVIMARARLSQSPAEPEMLPAVSRPAPRQASAAASAVSTEPLPERAGQTYMSVARTLIRAGVTIDSGKAGTLEAGETLQVRASSQNHALKTVPADPRIAAPGFKSVTTPQIIEARRLPAVGGRAAVVRLRFARGWVSEVAGNGKPILQHVDTAVLVPGNANPHSESCPHCLARPSTS